MSADKGDVHPSIDSMSGSAIDPEQLALLLEGKLDAHARAKLLTQLDASPESLEILSDASAVLPSLPRSTAWLRTPRSQWLAIAAVLVVAMVLPLLWISPSRTLPTPESVVSWLGPASALATQPWHALRGNGEQLSRDHRAVRVGALLMGLELRIASGDTSAGTAALQIAALLDGFPAGSTAGDAFRALAQSPNAAALRAARVAAEEMAGEQAVRAGAWLEAARIAAGRQDPSFFKRPSTSRAIDVSGGFAADVPTADNLRSLLQNKTYNWPAIGRELDTLLAAGAR
ncbi:MAG: hypothetical protein ACJ796_14215 [Gemmatimonadaceae bacterium]